MYRGLEKIRSGVAHARPFLRWAGGKQKKVGFLAELTPPSFRTYYEPFLGGGALFFRLAPQRAVLSDTNTELINCYRQVSQRPRQVSRLLQQFAKRDNEQYYLQVRITTAGLSPVERAARFIYLNRAAFNGMYRVSRSGAFNVPYGPGLHGLRLPSQAVLSGSARVLRGHSLSARDFQEKCVLAERGDFVFLDPPYPPRSKTEFFQHYSASRFGWHDQERLAQQFALLDARGCLVMLTIADIPAVRTLYGDFLILNSPTRRYIGSNGDRYVAGELVIRNFE